MSPSSPGLTGVTVQSQSCRGCSSFLRWWSHPDSLVRRSRSDFVWTAPLEKVHGTAWIYPIYSWIAKTLSKIYHLLLLFVYFLCSFSNNSDMQTHLERATSKEHQGKGSVCRQKMRKVIKWLAYNPKISQGQGQDEGCTRATTFIYPHTTLLLASFRRFELLSGFLCKAMAEQSKDSWISISGHRMLGLAATLVQYLLQLLPGESVFAECGSNSVGKTKYCTFDCYGWQFFCQVSAGRGYRVHLWDPDLRHFVPVSARVCAPPWAAQHSQIEIFFH